EVPPDRNDGAAASVNGCAYRVRSERPRGGHAELHQSRCDALRLGYFSQGEVEENPSPVRVEKPGVDRLRTVQPAAGLVIPSLDVAEEGEMIVGGRPAGIQDECAVERRCCRWVVPQRSQHASVTVKGFRVSRIVFNL